MAPLSQVPLIRAAIEEEAEARDAAFAEASAEICGVTVLPLSLRRYLILCASQNAFVTGGKITPEEAAKFLWVVSDRYNPGKDGLGEFLAEIGRKTYGEVLDGIADYLAFSFFDAPAAENAGEPAPSYYSFAATYVDVLGREYGWTFRDCLETPLPVLFQLLRRIQQRTEPGAILFNPLSDRARAEYVASLNPAA